MPELGAEAYNTMKINFTFFFFFHNNFFLCDFFFFFFIHNLIKVHRIILDSFIELLFMII